jgi:hypothetical protein
MREPGSPPSRSSGEILADIANVLRLPAEIAEACRRHVTNAGFRMRGKNRGGWTEFTTTIYDTQTNESLVLPEEAGFLLAMFNGERRIRQYKKESEYMSPASQKAALLDYAEALRRAWRKSAAKRFDRQDILNAEIRWAEERLQLAGCGPVRHQ